MAIDFTVPGIIVPVRQPSGMSCWAAMYTMMYSWKNQVSIPIRDAVQQLGQKYVDCFDQNTGLPIEENRNLAAAAGMTAEPLLNPTIHSWFLYLQNYGLLWTSYGWQIRDPNSLTITREGRHIIIIYGLISDGNPDGSATTIRYVDPSDGAFHTMPFSQFLSQHETGFTMRNLSDQQLRQFSQIMHY